MRDVLAVLGAFAVILLFFSGVFNARIEQIALEARIDYLEAQLELAYNFDRDNLQLIYNSKGKLSPLIERMKDLEKRVEELDPTHRFETGGSGKRVL